MVRDNRIKRQKVTLLSNGTAGDVGYTSQPLNGEFYAFEVVLGTAATADIAIYPSGGYGVTNLLMGFAQTSGTNIYYPVRATVTPIGAATTANYTKMQVSDYITVSGNNMGNNSGLSVNIYWR